MADYRYYTNLISERPDLFRNIIRYNVGCLASPAVCSSPNAQTQPDAEGPSGHSPGEAGSEAEREGTSPLSGIPAGLLALRAFQRAIHGAFPPAISPESFRSFASESERLLFLPDAVRERLFLLLSASAHAEEIARAIDGSTVRELWQAIGYETYAFALRRGRYANPRVVGELCRLSGDGSLADRILRLASIIPSLLADTTDKGPLSAEQRTALWLTLRNFLVKEVAPQWAPCFS